MPLVFIGAGTVFVLTGVFGDPAKLYELVKGDFQGPNNFSYWLLSMFVLGALGYIAQLRSLSRLFIALVVIVLVLHNHGFFEQFQAFIDSSKSATAGGQNQ